MIFHPDDIWLGLFLLVAMVAAIVGICWGPLDMPGHNPGDEEGGE